MKPLDENGWSSSSFIEAVIFMFKSGGFMAAVIGSAGMAANILLSDKKGVTWGSAASHMIAAGFVGWLTNQALQPTDITEGSRAACIGIAGAFAVQLKDACLRVINSMVDRWLKKHSP